MPHSPLQTRFLSFVSSWLPVFLWAGVIYYVSSLPSLNSGLGLWDFILRKIAHIVEFGLLTLFLIRAWFRTWPGHPRQRAIGLSALIAFLYAASDEIHQFYVPGRGAAVSDVLIDGCGVLICVLLYQRWRDSMAKKLVFLLAVCTIFSVGCGSNDQLKKGKKLEEKGKYQKAWKWYQEFAAEKPQSKLAPEALFRAGLVSQKNLEDCYLASTFYDRVIEIYPQSDPWSKAALLQKQNCPDYFPLMSGSRWVEGDSLTKGRNARIEIVCKPLKDGKESLPSSEGILEKSYFAGDNKSTVSQIFFKKEKGQLIERQKQSEQPGKVILQWPLEPGASWKTSGFGRRFNYKIEKSGITVNVRAGEFKNCLKVTSFITGYGEAATHEYYAPGVGRILTSISSRGVEKRNTELLEYRVADWTDPVKEEE